MPTSCDVVLRPGVWRDPAWILDEIDRAIERGKSTTISHALTRICRAHNWKWRRNPNVNGLLIYIEPNDPKSRHYRGALHTRAAF